MYYAIGALIVGLHVAAWLWRLNNALTTTPKQLRGFLSKKWSDEEIQKAYDNVRSAEVASRPKLRAKKDRRYIIVGGSGLSGGWIVQHLLWRGEDPKAIRILDLKEPARPEAKNLAFIRADVTDASSLSVAYEAPWPESVRSLPLTVFHCAALITVQERSDVFLDRSMKVNVEGVRSSMEAAKRAGADCFISTSSTSVAIRDVNYWHLAGPNDFVQIHPNAEPLKLDSDDFVSCYQYSKVAMEDMVFKANEDKFRTGCIRPGHPVYGHGSSDANSLTWRHLSAGGVQTWLKPFAQNFVHSINVSLGHLALEDRLLVDPSVGGKGYCVTEKPITYGEYYRVLETLAGAKFPSISPLPMLILSHGVEWWEAFRMKFGILPAIKGNLLWLQPATIKLCTAYFLFDCKLVTKELGYEPAFETLEGLCMTVKDWKENGGEKNATTAVPA